jgi:hypothetical protein
LGLLAGYVYAYAGDSPTNFTDPFSLQTTVTGPVTSPYPGTPSPTEVQEAVEAVEAALAGGGAAAAAATAGLVVVDAGLAYYDYSQTTTSSGNYARPLAGRGAAICHRRSLEGALERLLSRCPGWLGEIAEQGAPLVSVETNSPGTCKHALKHIHLGLRGKRVLRPLGKS